MKVKYFWSNLKYNIKRFLGIPKAIILCIRFPFLYPRNVWTGKHYTNWTISDKRMKLNRDKHVTKFNKEFHKTEDYWTSNWYKFQYDFLGYLEKFLAIFHCIPTHSLYNWIPEGWRKAFGIQMCKEIRHALYRAGGLKMIFKYRVIDIKEKYGQLRWYDAYSPVEVQKIIHKYEYISERTCIICGEPATCQTPIEYWMCPYCDKHAPKTSKFLLDFGLYENWYGYTGNINCRPKEEQEVRQKMVDDYKNIE